jgi:hypothetical protein
VEFWGILGQRSTWQPVPTSMLKRWIYSILGVELPQQPPARTVQAGSSIGGLDRQNFTSTFTSSRRAGTSPGSQAAPQPMSATGAGEGLTPQRLQAAPSTAGVASWEPQPLAASSVPAVAGTEQEPPRISASLRPAQLTLEAVGSTTAVLSSLVDSTLQCQSSLPSTEAGGSQELPQPAIAGLAQEVVVMDLQLPKVPALPAQQPQLAAARKARHRQKAQRARQFP